MGAGGAGVAGCRGQGDGKQKRPYRIGWGLLFTCRTFVSRVPTSDDIYCDVLILGYVLAPVKGGNLGLKLKWREEGGIL